MTIGEFLKASEITYHKYFPHSRCWAEYDTSLYRSIGLRCFLANKKEECAGLYWLNDMMKVSFVVQMDGNMQFQRGTALDTEMPPDLQIESSHTFYFTKPDNSYMAFGNTKVPFRKSHGDAEKILSVFDKFCMRLKDSIVQDYINGKIHQDYADLVHTKLEQHF